jgi:hypothetical protein
MKAKAKTKSKNTTIYMYYRKSTLERKKYIIIFNNWKKKLHLYTNIFIEVFIVVFIVSVSIIKKYITIVNP